MREHNSVKYETREATLDDIFNISPLIRHADVNEVFAASGCNIEESLLNCYELGYNLRVGLADGEYVAIYGAGNQCFMSDDGYVFLVGTDLIENHSRRFIQECRDELKEITKHLVFVENYCDARNEKVIRWLKWLGFTFADEPEPFGYLGLPFYHFWKVL